MDTLYIEPVEGRKLPLEGKVRKYVDGPMKVPNTRYYRMALRDGDIAEVKAAAKTKSAAPKRSGKDEG